MTATRRTLFLALAGALAWSAPAAARKATPRTTSTIFHSELLRISPGAHDVLIDLEELEERELDRIKAVYALLAAQARSGVSHGRSDSGVPAINDLVEKQVHKPRRKKKS